MNVIEIIKTHLPAVLAYTILVCALVFGLQLVQQAPRDLITLQSVTLQLKPGADFTLGRQELLQSLSAGAAEQAHVRFKRDAEGAWFVANVANSKRVDVKSEKKPSRFLKRWRIVSGDRIEIAGQILSVKDADSAKTLLVLANEATGQELTWEKGLLTLKGIEHAELKRCGKTAGAWWWRQLGHRNEIPLFTLGGLKDCQDRLAVPGAELQSAWIYWNDANFWLGPGTSLMEVYFQHAAETQWHTFSEIWVPLQSKDDPVRRFIIGRTHLDVSIHEDQLTLLPRSGQDLFYRSGLLQEKCKLVEQNAVPVCENDNTVLQQRLRYVRWQGEGLPLPEWLRRNIVFVAGVLVLGGLLTALMFYLSKRFAEPLFKTVFEILVVIPPLSLGLITLDFYVLGAQPDMTVLLSMLWLAWFWATLILHWDNRLYGQSGVLWCAAAGLASIGTLTLTQLGVGSLNNRWLGFAEKHIFILTVFAWIVVLLNVFPMGTWRRGLLGLAGGRERYWIVFRFAIPLSLVGVLVLQGLVGSESGLFGIQPIETVKFVLILMAGIVGSRLIELRRIGAETYRYNPMYFLLATMATALIFIVFTVAIMVAVRDFSPFLIVFSFMSALVWRLALHPERGLTRIGFSLRSLVLLPLILIVGLGYYIHRYQPQDMDFIPQYDRFRVWANPAAFPHTGAQLLGALQYVRLGHWQGGGAALFGENGDVVKVPAIHNDFVGAFLLYKLGGYAGLALLASQLVFLFVLWSLSKQAAVFSRGRDYRDREIWQIFSLVVFGVAWMYSVHWFISWGNVLGLLPVMGQPMTWISAANSHLLLFALPAFYISLVISWIAAEERRGEAY